MGNKERLNLKNPGYDFKLEFQRAQRLIEEKGLVWGLRLAIPGAIENSYSFFQEELARRFKNKVLIFSHLFSLVEGKLSSKRFGMARKVGDEGEESFISSSQDGGAALIEFREAGSFFWELGEKAGQVVSSYRDCFGRLPGMFLRLYTKKKDSYDIEEKNIYLRITPEEEERLQEKISQRMETQELKNDKGEIVGKFFVTDKQEDFLRLEDVVQMLKATLSPQRQEELSGWLANLEKIAAREEREIKADPQLSTFVGKGIEVGGSLSGISFGGEGSIGAVIEFKKTDDPKLPSLIIAQKNLGSAFSGLAIKENLTSLPQSKVVAQEGTALTTSSFQEEPHFIVKAREAQRQINQVEFLLNQPNILATEKLHNLPRSLEPEKAQITSIREGEEIPLKKGWAFDIEQQEVAKMVVQPAGKKEAVLEASKEFHPQGGEKEETEKVIYQSGEELPLKEPVEEIMMDEREEVVVFDQQRLPEETQIEREEKTKEVPEKVLAEKLSKQEYKNKESHEEVIEKRISEQKGQEEIIEMEERGIVLPKVEVWTPKVVHLTLPEILSWGPKERHHLAGLSTNLIPRVSIEFHPRRGRRWRGASWIELIPPKEISIIAALARDNFGINYPPPSATLADLTLFWLVAMNLFTQKPTLYKLELDFTPLTVNVKDGKILVARKAILKEILGIKGLPAEGRYLSFRPFLSLTV